MTRINLNGINELDLTLPGTTTASVANGVASVVNTNPSTSILLETNGTANGSQSKLNLVAGTDITLVDDGTGDVTISASGGGGYSLGGSLSSANIVLGSGAGTGATLTGIVGLDGNHYVEILIGTSPASYAPVWTVTFTASRGHNTYPLIVSNGAVGYSSLDQALIATPTAGTSYIAQSGNTPLVTGISYVWNVSCP